MAPQYIKNRLGCAESYAAMITAAACASGIVVGDGRAAGLDRDELRPRESGNGLDGIVTA
jgi:hypothetical protein